MTDIEIIKALSCCRDYVPCKNYCPYAKYKCTIDRECIPKLCEDALDLITRQKEEIERLKDMVSQNEGVLPRYEALIRAEAVKEFAEKIKKHCTSVELNAYIDSLVEEMEDKRQWQLS